jgi:CheY-like chemotaxis protein
MTWKGDGRMSDETPARETRPTILLIDDDRLVLGVCTAALEGHGYRVVMATHGQAGIAMAQRERPALILLDIMMSGMDGFEVCRHLRADPALRHTPIILMTAMKEPELEAKGAAAGATLSIRKPFDPGQIVNTVERALGRKLGSEPL